MSASRQERTYKVGEKYYLARIAEEKGRITHTFYNRFEAKETLKVIKIAFQSSEEAMLTGIMDAAVKDKSFWLTKEQDNYLILNTDVIVSSPEIVKKRHQFACESLKSTVAAFLRTFPVDSYISEVRAMEAKQQVQIPATPSKSIAFTGTAYKLTGEIVDKTTRLKI